MFSVSSWILLPFCGRSTLRWLTLKEPSHTSLTAPSFEEAARFIDEIISRTRWVNLRQTVVFPSKGKGR